MTLALALSAPAVAPGAATAAAGGRLTVTNSDVLPSSSAVVLSKIQNVADSSQRMHDRAVLRLTNTGTASLTVSALSTTGAFTITSPWRLPFILSSGSSVDVTVAFTATTGDWHTGRATLSWSDDQPRTTSVGLTGWWQKYSEKGLEPRLGDLVRNFGYGTVMPTAIYSRGAYRAFSSDEVLSPYWTLLDPAQPARITQIAAWRGYPTNVVVRTFPRGSSSQTSQVFSGLKNDAQSAFPRNTSWGRGTATFPAVGPVGL